MKLPFHRHILIGSLIALGIALFLPGIAHAATPPKTSLAISPPLFELSANPGDTLDHTIRVDNLTDQPLPISVARKDFVPMGEEGQAAITDKQTAFSLSSWIATDTTQFTIPAKSSQVVNFHVTVPQNASPGGHFGSIVFRVAPGSVSGNGVAVGQELGALLLLKVAGQVNEKASIASFGPTHNLWQKGPVLFDSRIKNEGNVQLEPSGTITISNLFGRKVGTVNLDSRTILPDSIRKISGRWPGSSWPGWYTATLSMSYGNTNKILTTSAHFVIFPYKIIIPILIILIVLGVFIFRARVRLKRSLMILLGKE